MENNKIKRDINNVVNDNLKALEQLFPSAVKDGQLDIKALKEELGDFEEVTTEKYELNWAGKQNAKKIVQQGIGNKTLKFVEKDSKNADTTENIYIEGDNLEVLKLLRQNYYNSIKMIYIDPPYNTGNDFVYNDTFKMDKEESDKAEGMISENNEKLQKNQKSTNRYHANWLNMMYPRLKLARDLLTDDGVIFISIDDNEQANLKRLCDEIFGEENFISNLVWASGRKNDSKYISNSHEYMLCFVKNIENLKLNSIIWREKKKGLEEIYSFYNELKRTYETNYKKMSEELKKWYKNLPESHSSKSHSHYSLIDEKGIFFADNISWPGGGGPKYDVLHPITQKPVKIPSRGWVYATRERMEEMIKMGKVYFGEDENTVPCLKAYLSDREYTTPYSVFYKDGRASTKRLRNLMEKSVFQNPKDEEIIKNIMEFINFDKNDTILDFFSGSATTAHAVMQLNSEDNGNRKYIMVQLPETTHEKSEAFKAGYKNIAEIGKERIRRAGEKIKQEIEDYNSNLKLGEEPKKVPDIGFKVFKVDDTNIKWYDLENFNEESQYSFDDPDSLDFVLGSNDIDIVYEIMLRQNDVPLSESLEVLTDIGNRTYLYASTYLICLETEITEQMVEKLASLEPLPIKFVFRDSAFKDNISLKDETFRKLRSLIERNSGESKVSYRVEFI
ncbi:MAG: site-specific DNA-methyltransferase [Leptotrichia hongkongensis]|nr:site-specific DNA-methyltransferase [Leptotrichia hongkongensis]